MTPGEKEALQLIDAMTGTKSTDEQMEFAADFTTPVVSFANPGTGKSHSLVKGLIMLQTYHRIPGKKINAMSFTREATAELKARYDRACKKCHITPTVNFKTFHSICREIVLNRFPGMRIKASFDWDKDLSALAEYMDKRDLDTEDMYFVRRVAVAIEKLNNSLCYDSLNVIRQYAFKALNIPIDIFQALRSDMFAYGVVMQSIPQGSIPLYALYVLANDKVLQQKYKETYKVMIVDEFQDMTKLYLIILSMISSNLIAIGDLKQQIYGFNGACAEIVDEYMKMYPDARVLPLTQSFRCKNEIADFATGVYWPNDKSAVPFKGTGTEAIIEIKQNAELNLTDIIREVKLEEDKEDVASAKSTMFLFRNNYAITPVAEELYKQGVLFRTKKLTKVMDYPVFHELSDLALVAMEPNNETYQINAIRWFPEFRKYSIGTNPYLSVIRGKDMFSVNYQFREESSMEFFKLMKETRDLIQKGAMATVVFNKLLPLYDKYIIEGKWYKLENDFDFYVTLVNSIIVSKTFPKMVAEEYEKARKVEEAYNLNMGVKCYTMHSAKGLEADIVYLLDMDDGIVPSRKNYTKLVKSQCEYEAAKMIREERNLLYVALTRAKEKVVITYYGKLTELISNPRQNAFTYLDEIYASTKMDFNDVESFLKSINLGGVVGNGNPNPPTGGDDDIDSSGIEDL